MSKERLTLYDTTLRDGQQTQGVQFSLSDKHRLTIALAELGIDYIEAGWPGANPTDSAYFEQPPTVQRAKITTFGMTKRAGRSAANDDLLAQLVNANSNTVCIVGKSHRFHVETALGIGLDENLNNIAESIAHLAKMDREAIFDAEHFFDGYKSDPDYAMRCLDSALTNGAEWVVLCDTNGGTLPSEISEITGEVIARGIPGSKIGIHTHNDTGTAVAGSLAAVEAGARQIQGTLNGLGERCGNADLVTLIPTLFLKEWFASRFTTGVNKAQLAGLTRVSRLLDDILNRVPSKAAPYVGASAFVHKAGLHASAVARNPKTYEHIEPEAVGNRRFIPMSNQAGRSNLIARLNAAGITVDKEDKRLGAIIQAVKQREDAGYSYDTAQASFELLARRILGIMPDYFDVRNYSVTVEHAEDGGEMKTRSRAEVMLAVGGQVLTSYADASTNGSDDQGPVHALARAVIRDLGVHQKYIEDMHLVDFKVRITGSGTAAVTRVIIDSEDRNGIRWSTVGVSANIIDASFEALIDAIRWKLVRDLPRITQCS